MKKKGDTYTVYEATKKLEHYCAYRERCRKEVKAKLRSLGTPPQAMDQIMAHLVNENYLNEERFAKSFARGKFTIKKWGRDRIVRELKQRQISSLDINSALAQISDITYQDTLEELAVKKWHQLNGNPLDAKKRKLSNYLLYRGWESSLVYEIVQRLGTKG